MILLYGCLLPYNPPQIQLRGKAFAARGHNECTDCLPTEVLTDNLAIGLSPQAAAFSSYSLDVCHVEDLADAKTVRR